MLRSTYCSTKLLAGSSGYRESGYFPEAVVNFLALLGWNPGTDQEIFSLDELVKAFDITKCSKSGAKFDYQKGIWFNHEYILRKSDDEIARLFAPIVANNGVDESFDRVKLVVHMMKDRVSFVKELWPLVLILLHRSDGIRREDSTQTLERILCPADERAHRCS